METIPALSEKSCTPCAAGTLPLSQTAIDQLLPSLEGWEQSGGEISKTFSFRNYHETMAFVNSTAWISHRQDHHPDLEVAHRQCRVRYSTHAIGGLSENDFICAAKIERLLLG